MPGNDDKTTIHELGLRAKLWDIGISTTKRQFSYPSVNGKKQFIEPDMTIEESKIVIEVDGEYHLREPQLSKDKKRDATIRRAGYEVIHVQNDDLRAPSDFNDFVKKIQTLHKSRLQVRPVRHQPTPSFKKPRGTPKGLPTKHPKPKPSIEWTQNDLGGRNTYQTPPISILKWSKLFVLFVVLMLFSGGLNEVYVYIFLFLTVIAGVMIMIGIILRFKLFLFAFVVALVIVYLIFYISPIIKELLRTLP